MSDPLSMRIRGAVGQRELCWAIDERAAAHHWDDVFTATLQEVDLLEARLAAAEAVVAVGRLSLISHFVSTDGDGFSCRHCREAMTDVLAQWDAVRPKGE